MAGLSKIKKLNVADEISGDSDYEDAQDLTNSNASFETATSVKSASTSAGKPDDKGAKGDKEDSDDDSDTDVPVDDERPTTSAAAAAAAAASKRRAMMEETVNSGEWKQKLPHGERKARKLLSKCGLKPITDVARVVMRKNKNILFVIDKPEVFKANNNLYIVFGDVRVEDTSQKAQTLAAEKFKKDSVPSVDLSTPVVEEDEPELEEDDKGDIKPEDIDLVMRQANVSRGKAMRALKDNDNDIVNAIMSLTML